MAETILTFKSLSLIDCVGFLTTLNCALNFSSAVDPNNTLYFTG